MRELVEAAVRAAGAQGLPTTVIIVGGVREARAVAAPGGGYVGAIEDVPGRLTLGHAEGLPAAPVVDPTPATLALSGERDKLAAEVVKLARERDGYSAEVRKLEAKLAGTPANGTGNGTGGPAAGEGIGAFGAEPITTLGLDDKTVKVATKMGYATVGALVALFTAPGDEDKAKLAAFVAKLTKDARIEVAERLLGRAPPAAHAVAVKGDGTEAPAAPGGASSGAPAEHKDKLWTDRIAAARRKEASFVAARTSAEEHRAGLLKRWPSCIGLDAENQEQVKRPKGLVEKDGDAFEALRHHYTVESGVAEVLLAQVQAILWACGLSYDDNDANAVDGALKRAGLVHLMESAPAAEGEESSEGDETEGEDAEVEETAGAEAE